MLRIILLFVFTSTTLGSQQLQIVNQWNLLNFNFPYGSGFIEAFQPQRTFFTGIEIADDRIFLAMPRVFSGVPASLAFISRNTLPGSSPILQAYPNWSYHSAGLGGNITDCSQIISVYRIRQDSCNRLWVLDAGVLTSLEDYRPTCTPKILIFDLSTDRLVRRIIFPREVLRSNSLLTNLVIDETVQGPCDSSFVYISDTVAPGILVYDSLKDTAWRVTHPSMFPDPDFADATIGEETFTLMDGIIGLAHSANLGLLYYQPYATDRIYSIPTAFLQKGPPGEMETVPVSLLGRKSSQGVGLAVDKTDDTIYFAPTSETSFASWNPLTNQQRLISRDPERLQFVAEIRYADKDGGNIWLISTRFHKFFRRTLDPQDVNLRIIRLVKRPSFITYLTHNSLHY